MTETMADAVFEGGTINRGKIPGINTGSLKIRVKHSQVGIAHT
jgi:hypothetical protein